MDDLAFARALHVIAVVHWIGGVAFVTLVMLPLAVSRGGADGIALFSAVEERFAAQVRWSIPLAGLSGLWLTYRMDLWGRFSNPHYWWMSAMAGLWLLFATMVFVLEPVLRPRFELRASRNPDGVLRRLRRVHIALLALAIVTVLGAVMGAHGFNVV
jgi:uncharacterized membrane protein